MEWLQQTWVIVAAGVGGITLIWNFFNKTVKEMTVALNKPMTEVSAKIDNLEQKLNSAEQSDTLIKSSLLSMQRQTLLHSCEDRIKAGYATISQKETISELYNSYHALGGDSFITDLVNQVKLLPLEKPVKVTRTKKTKTQLLVEGE